MSSARNDKPGDRVLAIMGLVFSVVYVVHARGIEDSFLADTVGVSGVPVAVGWLMGLACVGLLLRSFLGTDAAVPPGVPMPEQADAKASVPATYAQHLKAAGLMLILCAYVFALSWLGYVVAVGLLTGTVAWFAGARALKVVLALAVATGPLLWLLFDVVLKVRMPAGNWSVLLGN